jgi:2',3'-cyclic-nucleotide 2'-phosphodiesterase
MTISILYFGDIVGEPGRQAVASALPELRERFQPDAIFANADNATHGRGLSFKHYQELMKLGIDAVASGDHVWRYDDLVAELDNPKIMVCRPANYRNAPGRGYCDVIVKGKTLRLIHLQGQVFMQATVDSPFTTFDALEKTLPPADITVVDFHAEATSEKRCLAEHINGRAALVVGTHTHVPTADAQILDPGTAFLSDIGMCGPQDSSLGADKDEVLKNFLTGLPWRYTVAIGQCELGAVFCTVDTVSGKATHLEHIRLFPST